MSSDKVVPASSDGSEDGKSNQRRMIEKVAVATFVAINLVAPFAVGELYPFTVSPMFCDEPSEYCEYEILDTDGNSLPLREFGLQRNYDGNPPGLGVGIRPAATLDRFGHVPSEDELREHVRKELQRHPEFESVTVIQRVIGALDSQRVGVLSDRTLKIEVDREASLR